MIHQWYIDDISMIWLTRSVLIVRFLEKLNFLNSHDWPFWLTWFTWLLFVTHTIGLSDSHDSFLKRVTHVICFRSETACRVAWPRIDAYRSWAKKHKYCNVSVVTIQYCDMTDLIRLLWDPLIRNDLLILAITRFSNKALRKNMSNDIRLRIVSGTPACINDTSPIQPPLPYTSFPSTSSLLRNVLVAPGGTKRSGSQASSPDLPFRGAG